MEKNNAIGQRLGEWIKSSGKKKYEIAELLGILPQQLSHVLNGRDGLGKTMQKSARNGYGITMFHAVLRTQNYTRTGNPSCCMICQVANVLLSVSMQIKSIDVSSLFDCA